MISINSYSPIKTYGGGRFLFKKLKIVLHYIARVIVFLKKIF